MPPSAPRYRAFISYSTADRVIGERFQRAIENYRIPAPFRGVDRGFGPIPKRLGPLFRDRSDADVGGDLTETIVGALERSDALIVLCSPRSACAPWVNREIQRFIALGRGARIVAVLIDGQPLPYDARTGPDCALPPALFTRLDADGKVVVDPEHVRLAADLRPEGDGFDFAKLKIVAWLTGVPLTELTQRHLEAERRERRVIRLVAGVITSLSIGVATAAVFAYSAERTARERALKAIDIASGQIDHASAFVDEYGVSTSVLKKLLKGAEEDFTSIGGNDWSLVPALDVERGRLLAVFANVFGKVGDRDKQLRLSELALTTLDAVPVERSLWRPRTWVAVLPNRDDFTSARLDALEARASALDQNRSSRAADQQIVELLTDASRLAERERQSPARFWSLLAEFHYRRTKLGPAIAEQSKAIELLESAPTRSDPTEASQLAYALSRRAEFLLESERPAEGLEDHKKALEILEPLAKEHSLDMGVLGDFSSALTQYADALYAACGSWTMSIPIHQRAVDNFWIRHKSDRTRVDYMAELAVALEHLGDGWLQTREFRKARGAFDDMRRLREDVASIDPDGIETRRDLALAYEREGDLALEQNDRSAVQWFEKALKTLTEKARPAGQNEDDRKRDIALASRNLAKAMARFERARPWEDTYRQAIEILDALVAQQDRPLGWLRDLAAVHTSYAEDLSNLRRLEPARQHWARALQLLQDQLRENPDDPRLPADIAEVQASLGMPVALTETAARPLPKACQGS